MDSMRKLPRNYDVYPLTVAAGEEAIVHIRHVGKQTAYPHKPLTVQVLPLQERAYPLGEVPASHGVYTIAPETDGTLIIAHRFSGEQEYYIRVFDGEEALCQVSVYALNADLLGRIPLMGDMHMHTMRSDGGYDPAVVAAEARRHGMDYIAITDHHNITGSLEAIEAYADVPLDLNMMYGEEVHMPDAEIHVVNFGCRYSVNTIAQWNADFVSTHCDPAVAEKYAALWRTTEGGEFPGTMSDGAFRTMIWEYAKTLDIPEGLPVYTYACYRWVCEAIRRTGGLAIFAHPYWINDLYHVDERLTEFILRAHDYDAYEVLGGESYFEQNGHQTAQYYALDAACGGIPIVGNSDTHRIYENRDAYLASTIVFAEANTQEAIHAAIRARKTVAVDWISASEPRLVGEYRLVKYAQFLMNTWFPKHRRLCEQEGTAMLEYAYGEREEGERVLRAMRGRIPHMWKKYFG